MLIIASMVAFVSAQTSVGVKKGDWIDYQVTVTGNPPADHDIVWARMEVTGVQGEVIRLDIQTEFSNGTIFPGSITLNLATGVLGDDFIIPENLNIGDTFHDQYQGTITITNVTKLTVAGAERSVISGSTPETTYNWDRQTGILVDANSFYPEYSMTTKTSGTNMWQLQIFGVDPIVIYVLVIAVLTSVVVVAIFGRKKKNP
jgi:hypothetical protein